MEKINLPPATSLAGSLMGLDRPKIAKEERAIRNAQAKATQASYEKNKLLPCSKCGMAPRHITKNGKAGSSRCKSCADVYRKKRRE